MKRRNLLQLGLLGGVAASTEAAAIAPAAKHFNIVEASAADLQSAMAQGRCSWSTPTGRASSRPRRAPTQAHHRTQSRGQDDRDAA